MNNWPEKVFGITKDGKSILFSPTAAKETGYIVQPLVEIDPEDIIKALSEDFGISIDYVYLVNIKIDPKEEQETCTSCEVINLVAMHKSHFLNEISSGIYLEAAFVSEDVLIFMLGNEESWIVLDSRQYQKTLSKLNHLIKISKNNIKVLRKEDRFDRF
jgi:hypothetical protein